MEEMHWARYGEGAWSFHAFSGHASLPAPPHVQQLESSLNPILLGFYGGFVI